jgi:hypothetical protein
MGVVFVNRRILDQGGKRQNVAVASVVKDARACRGLLQLDPLDAQDRYSYLCLSLKASWVPPEVNTWVSSIANGNPQYTEICAQALEKAGVLELRPGAEGQLPRAEFKGAADSLAKLEPPPKVPCLFYDDPKSSVDVQCSLNPPSHHSRFRLRDLFGRRSEPSAPKSA